MYYVAETIGPWHEHGVDVGLPEKCERNGNGRRNMETVEETRLAFMARLDEPADVLIELGPPKSFEKSHSDRKYAFMTHFIVCLLYELKASRFRYHQFVLHLRILLPKSTISNKESSRISNKSFEGIIRKVWGTFRIKEERLDLLELEIARFCFI
jgi:hypothetical protein